MRFSLIFAIPRSVLTLFAALGSYNCFAQTDSGQLNDSSLVLAIEAPTLVELAAESPSTTLVLSGNEIPWHLRAMQVGRAFVLQRRELDAVELQPLFVAESRMSEQGAEAYLAAVAADLESAVARSATMREAVCSLRDESRLSRDVLAEILFESERDADLQIQRRISTLLSEIDPDDRESMHVYVEARSRGMTVTEANYPLLASTGELDVQGYSDRLCAVR